MTRVDHGCFTAARTGKSGGHRGVVSSPEIGHIGVEKVIELPRVRVQTTATAGRALEECECRCDGRGATGGTCSASSAGGVRVHGEPSDGPRPALLRLRTAAACRRR